MRALIRVVFELLVRLFFPTLAVEGRDRLPASGPCLYVLNHPNGLLDPVVLRVAIGRPVSFLAKSTLFANPAGRFLMEAFAAIPVYRRQDADANANASAGRGGEPDRNERTFALCRAVLGRGGSVALFPEGVSHAEPTLRPLKTGAARIALSALREHGGALALRVVPVGLSYEDRAVFRSRALLVVGEPIDAADFYARYERDERDAVDALTAEIRARLDGVVLQAETRELLEGVAAVAEWTAEGTAARDDLGVRENRARALLAAYASLRERDPARLERVVAEARGYARVLRALGVTDPWALEVGRVPLRTAARVTLKLLALSPLALLGAAMGWVPYRAAGRVAEKLAREEDVLGTVKLLAGALFLLLTWAAEGAAVGIVSHRAWAGALVALAGPVTGYAALRWDEIRQLWVAGARHLWFREWKPETVRKLAARRLRLAQDVAEALRQAQGGSAPTVRAGRA